MIIKFFTEIDLLDIDKFIDSKFILLSRLFLFFGENLTRYW